MFSKIVPNDITVSIERVVTRVTLTPVDSEQNLALFQANKSNLH